MDTAEMWCCLLLPPVLLEERREELVCPEVLVTDTSLGEGQHGRELHFSREDFGTENRQ